MTPEEIIFKEKCTMGKYDGFKDIDVGDPAEVVEKIRLAVETDSFSSPEERLYAIGWVLDRNRVQYINSLKKKRDKLEKRCAAAESMADKMKTYEEELKKKDEEIKRLAKLLKMKDMDSRRGPSENTQPKKKIVVIRRKTE